MTNKNLLVDMVISMLITSSQKNYVFEIFALKRSITTEWNLSVHLSVQMAGFQMVMVSWEFLK